MNNIPEQLKKILLRGFIVIGVIAILFIGFWGAKQVVKLIPRVFPNLASVTIFTSVFIPNEKISINTPDSPISSDTIFELTWKQTGKSKNREYTFNYVCRDGLSFQISPSKTTDKEEYQTIKCNSPSRFSSNTNSVFLIPTSKVSRFVDMPITITSINKSGEPTTFNDSLLSIVNKSIPENQNRTSNTKETTIVAGNRVDEVFPINSSNSRSISNPNGRVDLVARIIDTGIIDTDNVFISTSSISIYNRGVVKFSVTNIGSKTSDNWTFNAVLPTFPMYIFHSKSQKALAPGDRIEFTLGFDQLNGNLTKGVITINVDPSGSIRNELNRNNNIVQTTIEIVK